MTKRAGVVTPLRMEGVSTQRTSHLLRRRGDTHHRHPSSDIYLRFCVLTRTRRRTSHHRGTAAAQVRGFDTAVVDCSPKGPQHPSLPRTAQLLPLRSRRSPRRREVPLQRSMRARTRTLAKSGNATMTSDWTSRGCSVLGRGLHGGIAEVSSA